MYFLELGIIVKLSTSVLCQVLLKKGSAKDKNNWDVNDDDDDNNADNDNQTIDCDQKSSPETSAQVS